MTLSVRSVRATLLLISDIGMCDLCLESKYVGILYALYDFVTLCMICTVCMICIGRYGLCRSVWSVLVCMICVWEVSNSAIWIICLPLVLFVSIMVLLSVFYALHTQYIFRTDPLFFGGCVSCRAGTPRRDKDTIKDISAVVANSICSWRTAKSEYGIRVMVSVWC